MKFLKYFLIFFGLISASSIILIVKLEYADNLTSPMVFGTFFSIGIFISGITLFTFDIERLKQVKIKKRLLFISLSVVALSVAIKFLKLPLGNPLIILGTLLFGFSYIPLNYKVKYDRWKLFTRSPKDALLLNIADAIGLATFSTGLLLIYLNWDGKWVIIIGLLAMGLASYIWNQKTKKEIISRKETEDKLKAAYKEITDSINYAERIQRSFLATEDVLNRNLGEYFVYFNTKEAVSGDFYWAGELTNGDFAMVNADSTGHGVPGAIMSILNVSSIEKAVENNATIPADIFNQTRKTIIERLKKDGSEAGGKDGMDASLISFNKYKTKMTYVAAQNPIWIIREGELTEIKPEKMPVGKHVNDHASFKGGVYDIQKGDLIYTLTDGFQDQFGGPKGKKFMVKKMREYVLSISNSPMKEQHQKITDAFSNWKGDLEQVDDVCVIGVRI